MPELEQTALCRAPAQEAWKLLNDPPAFPSGGRGSPECRAPPTASRATWTPGPTSPTRPRSTRDRGGDGSRSPACSQTSVTTGRCHPRPRAAASRWRPSSRSRGRTTRRRTRGDTGLAAPPRRGGRTGSRPEAAAQRLSQSHRHHRPRTGSSATARAHQAHVTVSHEQGQQPPPPPSVRVDRSAAAPRARSAMVCAGARVRGCAVRRWRAWWRWSGRRSAARCSRSVVASRRSACLREGEPCDPERHQHPDLSAGVVAQLGAQVGARKLGFQCSRVP